jgi:hypothetical protein
MSRRIALAAVAYLVPTFALGFVWHLKLFTATYDALAMYRHDVIIPLGFASMLVQSIIFAFIYVRVPLRTVSYALLGAALSWSFTTLAVAAKNVMTSVPQYLLIESGFTLAQWVLVAPLTSLLLSRERVREAA